MMNLLSAFTHLFFPHICAGCGTDILDKDAVLCSRCYYSLPLTNFNTYPDNRAEKIFRGRLQTENVSSLCYFSKDSLIRPLIHQLKYQGKKEIGLFLGKLMGQSLKAAERFNGIDALVPLPLFAAKERKRGYNQSAVLCEGMSEAMGLPLMNNVIKRISSTDTQTKKSRMERWQNMENRFELAGTSLIKGLHVLLVDDILTTGATLEACGQKLLTAANVKLSIATLAFTVN